MLDEWKEYFEKLLKGQLLAHHSADIPSPARQDLNIDSRPITREEVMSAIKTMNNGRAPGLDETIVAELLKKGGETVISKLHQVCQRVFEGESPPWQWTTSKVVPIPKKGDLSLMSNYRGIWLTSAGAKVYNRVLLNRIRPVFEGILRPNQAGFRPGRGTVEQIAALRRIIEGATAKQLPLVICFVDFKKAFDLISREMLFAVLRHYGVPVGVVKAIKSLYDGSKARVFVENTLSKEFNVTTGVLQGDVLAPYLFIIVDYVLKVSISTEHGFEHQRRKSSRSPARMIADLDYADDIAILESSVKRAMELVQRTSDKASLVGLLINEDKTECMVLNQAGAEQMVVNGKCLKRVENFKYLGALMASVESEINNRLALAWAVFWKLKKVWMSTHVTERLKINIFGTAVVAILLYGCECWPLTKSLEGQINSFATQCYRIMLGINLAQQHISNAELLARVRQPHLVVAVRRRQLRWLGHVLRRGENEPARIFALYQPEEGHGTAKQGKPKTTWCQYIARILEPHRVGLSAQNIAELAKDRSGWRKIVAVCSSYTSFFINYTLFILLILLFSSLYVSVLSFGVSAFELIIIIIIGFILSVFRASCF